MTTLALGPSWLDPDYLLNQFGLWGLLLIVFAESGLLIGFFLPGDSLLFTTGLLITTGKLDTPLWLTCILICIAAIAGDQAGYLFGKKVGPSLFNRPDSKLFKQENVVKAHEFFEKHGPKSLVLARFVPIVRTFTPIIAGVSGMRYRSFITFNILGGVLWGAGVTLLGAWLGKHELVHKNIEAILILIVLISVVPIIIEFLRARGKGKKGTAQTDDQASSAQPSAQDDGHTGGEQYRAQAEPQYPYQGRYGDQQHHQPPYPGQQQYQGGQYGDQQYGGQQHQGQYGDQQYQGQYGDQQHQGQYGNDQEQYGNDRQQYGGDQQQYGGNQHYSGGQYQPQQPQHPGEQGHYPDQHTQFLGQQPLYPDPRRAPENQVPGNQAQDHQTQYLRRQPPAPDDTEQHNQNRY
ncbi:DedA family protein [Streptomyces sp. NPDC017941]|uniref:DedA family protein n=1 Tax=Streptomyces sp. NPDC017941 TaxID=3365018 RepID=UPI0037997EC2